MQLTVVANRLKVTDMKATADMHRRDKVMMAPQISLGIMHNTHRIRSMYAHMAYYYCFFGVNSIIYLSYYPFISIASLNWANARPKRLVAKTTVYHNEEIVVYHRNTSQLLKVPEIPNSTMWTALVSNYKVRQ